MTTSSPDLDSLRLFLKVAELGSISQTALAVGLSQPSVSRSLRALEENLQSSLFHRTGRGVQLTEVGEQAVVRARTLVDGADQFADEIRNQAQAPSGVVTVALLTAYMRDVAPDLFEEVRRRFPGVVLRLLESFSVQHEDWLASGRVDIALVTRYRKPSRDGQEVLAVSDMVVVGNPAVGGGEELMPFKELASLPLVLPAAPNGLRVRMEDVARRVGIRLNVVLEADSIEAQRAIIARERCYVMWSQHSVRQSGIDAMFASRRIVEPRLPRYVVLQTTTHHPLSRAAREVARILRRLVLAAHGQAG